MQILWILICVFVWGCSSGSSAPSPAPSPDDENPQQTNVPSELPSAADGDIKVPSATRNIIPGPRVTSVTLGPVGADEEFTLEVVKNDIKGLAKEVMWVDRDFNFTDRANEENLENTERVLQDIRECGFTLLGPACIDSQKIVVSPLTSLAINGKPYIFMVFSYSMVKFPYAAFFEYEDTATGTSVKSVFVYELSALRSSYSPYGVLKETLGKAVAVFEVSFLQREQTSALLKRTTNLRKKLYLLRWLASASGTFDPLKVNADKEMVRRELLEKESDVVESGDLNLFYLYLQSMHATLDEENYHLFLKTFENDINNVGLQCEVSIELLMLGEGLSASHLKSLKRAFLQSNVLTILRALDVVVGRKEEFPPDFFGQVIPLLNAEEAEISHRAALVLTGMKIPEDQLPLVGKLIKKPGRNEYTFPYALELLYSSRNPIAFSLIFAELSNANEEIRDVIYFRAANITSDNIYLPILQAQLDKSEEVRILELIINKVSELKTPEATSFIIDNLYHAQVFVREKVMSELKTRLVVPENLDGLLKAYEKKDVDARLAPIILDTLIRLNEPRGLNPVLDLIRNSEDEEERHKYIEQLQNGRFGPENLEILDLGVVSYKSDVKSAFIEFVLGIDDFGANDILIALANLNKDTDLETRILDILDGRALGGRNPENIKNKWMGGVSKTLRQKGIEYILRSEGPLASRVMAHYLVDYSEAFRKQVVAELDKRAPVREMWDELIYNIMGGRVDEVIGGTTIYTSPTIYSEAILASFRYLRPLVGLQDIPDLIRKFACSNRREILQEFVALFKYLRAEYPQYFSEKMVREALIQVLKNNDFKYPSLFRVEGQAEVIKWAASLGDEQITAILVEMLKMKPEQLHPTIFYTLQELFGVL